MEALVFFEPPHPPLIHGVAASLGIAVSSSLVTATCVLGVRSVLR